MAQAEHPGDHRRVFLTARWEDLINLTYSVPEELLRPHLPPGLELDIFEGSAHVSLVAFDFLSTRILGMPIPTYRNFPEINLRFYVRWQGKPAVVFIREFVPKRAIAWSARFLYNEPYRAIQMTSRILEDSYRSIEHKIADFSIKAIVDSDCYYPEQTGAEHHFKEHDLGFGVSHGGQTLAYRVEHPIWKIHKVQKIEVNLDFTALYGDAWSILNHRKPAYALVARGSEIKVRFPFKIK